jgi:hypothetical protein
MTPQVIQNGIGGRKEDRRRQHRSGSYYIYNDDE